MEDSKDQVESTSPKKKGPTLKLLPEYLRYAFLGGQYKFSVIISVFLSPLEEEKLIEVLRKHKSALDKIIINNLKKRLEAAKGMWVEELPRVLWAHQSTPKMSMVESLYSFVYRTKVVIPTKVVPLTLRAFTEEYNSKALALI